MRSQTALATSLAALLAAVRSARRRRFSINTTRSVVGKAHKLADRQLAGFLIGLQEMDQQRIVERAVGVGDESPGHAIDARQPDQRFVQQHRQVAKVTTRQALGNLATLRLDQVKVVEQPFGCGTDIVTRAPGLLGDVGVRLSQGRGVVAQARKERRRTGGRETRRMRQAETAPVLGKSLRAEDLGTKRRAQQRRGQDRAACRRRAMPPARAEAAPVSSSVNQRMSEPTQRDDRARA